MTKAKKYTPMVMRNQFFGMMLVAMGVGALIVLIRYLIVARAMPAEIMEIKPELLIPGNN